MKNILRSVSLLKYKRHLLERELLVDLKGDMAPVSPIKWLLSPEGESSRGAH